MQNALSETDDVQKTLTMKLFRAGLESAKPELEEVVQIAAHSMSAPMAAITLRVDNACEVVVSHGLQNTSQAETIFDWLYTQNAFTGEPDLSEDHGSMAGAFASAPIVVEDSLHIGDIAVLYEKSRDAFTSAEVTALTSLAKLAASALMKRSLRRKGETAFAILQHTQKLSKIAHFLFDPQTFKTISISKSMGVFYDGDGKTDRQGLDPQPQSGAQSGRHGHRGHRVGQTADGSSGGIERPISDGAGFALGEQTME